MTAFQAENRHATAQRRFLIGSLVLFVASRAALLASPWPHLSDVPLYCQYAVRGVDQGEVPYRDFAIEYPPLAWDLIAIPRLLAAQRCPADAADEKQAACQTEYRRVFRGLMLLADVLSLGLVWAIARRRDTARYGSLCLAYVAVTSSSAYLLYDRLDLGLLLLLLLWAYCWLRSTEAEASSEIWRIVSYGALGLAVAYKLIPILMLPYLIVADRRAWPGVRGWTGLAAFVAAVAVPFLLLYPRAGMAPLHFLEYHRHRGIQVESIYAVLLYATSWFGSQIQIVYAHRADEVVSAWAPAMKTFSHIAVAGFLVAVGLWCMFQRQFNRKQAWLCAVITMLGAVGLAPVLSTQYFVWALPLMLLVAGEVFPADDRTWPRFAIATIVIAVLTMLIFPCTYFGLVDKLQPGEDRRLIPLARGLVAVRDVGYLALVALLAVWAHYRPEFPNRQFSSGGTLP